MSRLFVPLDVNFCDDPKVIEAGPDAELVYLRSLMLAKRLGGDGFIHRNHLHRLCGGMTAVEHQIVDAPTIAGYLVEAGLWVEVDDGWLIAAWLKHNPSDDDLAQSRRDETERKAKWRKSRRDETTATDRDGGTERRATDRDTHEVEERVKRSESEENLEPSVELALVSPPATDPVDVVFDAWQQATGHHKAILDKKRRAAITKALGHYPVEDLVAACRGVMLFSHNRGETNGTRYDDLTLVLRDSEHVERFRDRYLGGEPRAAPRMPAGTDMSAQWLARKESHAAP